jgi:hypothetical protein
VLADGLIFPCTQHYWNQSRTKLSPTSLYSLSLRLGGITPPEKTAEGYELRSRGPASQGFDALDSHGIVAALEVCSLFVLAHLLI